MTQYEMNENFVFLIIDYLTLYILYIDVSFYQHVYFVIRILLRLMIDSISLL